MLRTIQKVFKIEHSSYDNKELEKIIEQGYRINLITPLTDIYGTSALIVIAEETYEDEEEFK